MNKKTQHKTEVPVWNEYTRQVVAQLPPEGIFLTGIENSDPIVDHTLRRDQLREAHNFYENYKKRLKKISHLGVSWIRFGPSYSQVHQGPDVYDFSFADKVLKECKKLQLTVVADLLHFGLPEWLHHENPQHPFFQNELFPDYFAQYARAFALRYPDVTFFTPVNEPFVTVFFSSKLGIWNEGIGTAWNDDHAFVRATANIARAAILAKQEILKVWGEQKREGSPIFVQNDSFEKAIAAPSSGREQEAKHFNIRKFLPLDLIFGHRDNKTKALALAYGLKKKEYDWFMQNGSITQTILGIDHYPMCVHYYEKEYSINQDPSAPYQLESLAKEYWWRYQIPLLHLEVNGWPEHALNICLQTYDTLQRMRREGYPVVGMSWFGDEYQVGWHTALAGPGGFEETPVGLHYKGKLQPVGRLFQQFSKAGFSLDHPKPKQD